MTYHCSFCQSEIYLENKKHGNKLWNVFGKYICNNHIIPVAYLIVDDVIDSICIIQEPYVVWISMINDEYFGDISIFTKGIQEAYKANLATIYDTHTITYEMILNFLAKFKDFGAFI